MPIRELPENPNLEHLKNEAKSLQHRVRSGDSAAVAAVREFHPRLTESDAAELTAFSRADAQLVTARQYGHPSRPRLRAYVALISRRTRAPHRQTLAFPIQSEPADAGGRARGPVDVGGPTRHGSAGRDSAGPRSRPEHPLRGVTAYEWAALHGSKDIAALLADAGARVPELDRVQEFLAAAMNGEGARVAELMAEDPTLGRASPWNAAGGDRARRGTQSPRRGAAIGRAWLRRQRPTADHAAARGCLPREPGDGAAAAFPRSGSGSGGQVVRLDAPGLGRTQPAAARSRLPEGSREVMCRNRQIPCDCCTFSHITQGRLFGRLRRRGWLSFAA